MIEDARAGIEHLPDRVGVAAEVGRKHLDGRLGERVANGGDGEGEVAGAAVGKSSRVTLVRTTWRSRRRGAMRARASRLRASGEAGAPHRAEAAGRLQTLPRIRNVAVPR